MNFQDDWVGSFVRVVWDHSTSGMVRGFSPDGYIDIVTLDGTKKSFPRNQLEWIEMSAKDLWSTLTDVPINDTDEEDIDIPWFDFPKGTPRQDIWHWFEDTFDVRVADLMGISNGQQDELEEDAPVSPCPACSGPGFLQGVLGNLAHFRCAFCGIWFYRKVVE